MRLTAALSFITLLSCSSYESELIYEVASTDGSKQQYVSATELIGTNFGPINQFGLLTELALYQDKIVVKDEKKDYLFSTITQDGDLVTFQPVGEGPNRVKHPNLIKTDGNITENQLRFFSFENRTISAVDIKPDALFSTQHEAPNKYWGLMQDVVSISDSTAALTGGFSDTKFVIYDSKSGQEVVRSAYYDSFSEPTTEPDRIKVAPTDIEFNKKHGLIILRSSAVNSIDTYFESGQLNRMYTIGTFNNVSQEGAITSDFFYHYSLKTQGDLAYALYLGQERSAIAMQDIFLNGARPELHVINLVTHELTRFRLDRLVNACVIDEKNSLIYCIEEDNENQPLVRYEIPKIL